MKNYNYETDVIGNPDPLYGTNQKVRFGDCIDLLVVRHSQWDYWNKTWTYALDNAMGDCLRCENAAEKELRPIK